MVTGFVGSSGWVAVGVTFKKETKKTGLPGGICKDPFKDSGRSNPLQNTVKEDIEMVNYRLG